ncbi:MAG TPA: glutamate racemase [Ignavibacteriaceae bacterium]|jgi:glutamate racemase|nr:MAG: Glutamate racemase [Ignavibacteria bacterium ADurb.Bin266]OQY71624.1 MAG: glutamate racemase [Ignavibacteriales bacterium UTCHB2]HQF41685.1 glutamate racemase [Ignavibacteriaceae bacterium]HQI42031.1 glutamate racemase [Ignavibacteriaceae bacterium]
MEKEKPIGVFDSGIGGLTVVKRLISSLPRESIVYFGDTARVPYGSKSNSTVIDYSVQNTNFLLSKNVKAIVVACNTASSIAIPSLKEKFDVPVIGVILPGADMAVNETKNGKIGVIGTRATISNQAYSKAINELDNKIKVYEKACPLFVPLAEEGWTHHKATYDIAEEYLKELRGKDIDTLVLGCTHYPILVDVIQDVIGKNVKLIDSGIATAEVVKNEINRIGFETNSAVPGNLDLYVSDIPTTFKQVAELFLGKKINEVVKVDIEELHKI